MKVKDDLVSCLIADALLNDKPSATHEARDEGGQAWTGQGHQVLLAGAPVGQQRLTETSSGLVVSCR